MTTFSWITSMKDMEDRNFVVVVIVALIIIRTHTATILGVGVGGGLAYY